MIHRHETTQGADNMSGKNKGSSVDHLELRRLDANKQGVFGVAGRIERLVEHDPLQLGDELRKRRMDRHKCCLGGLPIILVHSALGLLGRWFDEAD